MENIITPQDEKGKIKMHDLVYDETERKIKAVPESKQFGITICCMIDNEFVLCSDFEVPSECKKALELA
jgi:hypothetical protein